MAIHDKDDLFSLLDAEYSRQEKLLKPFMEVWPYSIHPDSDTVYKVSAGPSLAQEVQRFLPFICWSRTEGGYVHSSWTTTHFMDIPPSSPH